MKIAAADTYSCQRRACSIRKGWKKNQLVPPQGSERYSKDWIRPRIRRPKAEVQENKLSVHHSYDKAQSSGVVAPVHVMHEAHAAAMVGEMVKIVKWNLSRDGSPTAKTQTPHTEDTIAQISVIRLILTRNSPNHTRRTREVSPGRKCGQLWACALVAPSTAFSPA
jgi:hypothetical protein